MSARRATGARRSPRAAITLVAALVTALAPSRPARAQRATPAAVSTPGARRLAVADARRDATRAMPGDDGTAERPTVVARDALPGSFQVVSVPLPASLHRGTVRWRVSATGVATLLSPVAGRMSVDSAAPRSLLLTLAVPAHAPAGRRTAARVEFVADGAEPADVAVALDVPVIHGATLAAARSLSGARAGETFDIAWRLTNTGNAPDTLRVAAEPPAGWRIARGAPRVVAAGETVVGTLRLTTPPTASGSTLIRLTVRAGIAVRARADVLVEAAPRPGESTRRAGPELRVSAATATQHGGVTSPEIGLAIEGPIADSLALSARVDLDQPDDPAAARALLRLGYTNRIPQLELTAPRWQLDAGLAGITFSDLSGFNVWGRGAAWRYADSTLHVDALAAVPVAFPGARGPAGDLVGSRVALIDGDARVTGALTHLDERGVTGRYLNALTLGGDLPVAPGTRLQLEAGPRWYDDATPELGWSTGITRDTPDDELRARWMHAPGGSAAFAPGVDQLTLSGTHALTSRILLGASAWRTEDRNHVFSRLRSGGWSLQPQYIASRTLALSLELRGTAYEAAASSGAFGSSEQHLALTANVHRGALFALGTSALGTRTRTASPATGGTFAERAPYAQWNGFAGWATVHGTVGITADVEDDGALGGIARRQNSLGVQLDRVPVPVVSHPVYLRASALRSGWFGGRAPLTVFTAGAETWLPAGFLLTVDAEHDPLLGASSAGHWVGAVRIEHALRVPGLSDMLAPPGVVYEDLNANGVRDRGEPGYAGAVIRLGGATEITDRDGRFATTTGAGRAPVLDPRSLPLGWIESPQPIRRESPERHVAIGVIPTATLDVTLRVEPAADGRVPAVDLSKATVVVRDTLGRVWGAQPTSDGRARFDALLPGTYTVELQLEGLGEPLHPAAPIPAVTVRGADARAITVSLRPRPIRIWRAPLPPADSGAAPAPPPLPSTTPTRTAP